MITKTKVQRIGGSMYSLIPAPIVDLENLKDVEEVWAEYQHPDAQIKEICKIIIDKGEETTLKTGGKVLKGIITELNSESITFTADEQNYIIPYGAIQELNLQDKK